MLFLVRWVSLLLIWLTGCAPLLHTVRSYQYTHLSSDARAANTVYYVYIDADFGQADLVSLENALHQWNYVMNGYAHFEIVSTHFQMGGSELQQAVQQNAFLLLKIDSHSPLAVKRKSTSQAFVDYIGGHHIYFIRDRLHNERMLSTTLHELGHTLGAQHTEGGLMAPYASPEDYRCVDYFTAEQVARFNGWDLSHMNYCLVGGEELPNVGQ